MKLTISRKLLFGYLIMALLTVLASTYALWNLRNLHQVAYQITNRDFLVVETCKSMRDSLLAQEGAEKKYFVFKDPSLVEIFRASSQEFKAGLEKLKKINSAGSLRIINNNIEILHDRYDVLFHNEISLVKEGRIAEALNISDTESKQVIDEIASKLKNIQRKSDEAINDDMKMIAKQGGNAIKMTIGISLFSLILGITLALAITRSIAKPIKRLQKATGLIAEGKLDYQIEIDRKDEIGDLAEDFANMTQRLKILEAMNLDASPLTGLPGNLAIENRIKELLSAKQKFSLCQVDLDNFKPFADKYGYAWGSEVIKEVADILKENVGKNINNEVFIGHIGGDDFVVIAEPVRAQEICRKLVEDFAKRIWKYYDVKDAEQGYIMGHDRQGTMRKFPLITISVASVTDDGSRFGSPLDMAMTVAELKEYAKSLPGSNYVTEEDVGQSNYKNNEHRNGV